MSCRSFRLPHQWSAAILVAACISNPALPVAVQAAPRQVLLIRHGHKLGEGGNFNLSRQGLERVSALAGLIPACFGEVTHIVTYGFNPDTGKNARSYQSAVPLAVFTGVNIRLEAHSESDSAEVGRRIVADPAYEGGRLVLFWEHRRLPQLAAGLGWTSMPAIADDDFDSLDMLSYVDFHSAPSVRRYNQTLLLKGRERCPDKPHALTPP